ncbi:hypothetical protein O6H91_06G082700 [Diphasiastrum complanatum]|uniref:Uncharacterized protein n=1 Tax=Diphasiastrum complanatum TaxID=34168 RepID=A0ACC2DFJ9_DIPCM|nr:hypothetical protein O6H91_06G082700 [Diphasiastrum complanatum]
MPFAASSASTFPTGRWLHVYPPANRPFSVSQRLASRMAPEKLSAIFFQAPKRLRTTDKFSRKVDAIANLGGVHQVMTEGAKEKEVLNQDQKIRMELKKAIACAKKNLRVCQERVAECEANGIVFPNIADLLVQQSWLNVLQDEFKKPYMEKLCQFVMQEANGKIPIYPPPAQVFHAFNTCPLDKVKVVIIGQDPYHGAGQAMGLCFSVQKGVKIPSSLLNIYKEIQQDVGCTIPSHGNLETWAHQGVLLLNTVLTVREHHANSHAKKGWEPFTDAATRLLSQQRSGIIFLLWGNSAQEKIRLIKANGHHILKAAHPSGLSAHKGFFNCRSDTLFTNE